MARIPRLPGRKAGQRNPPKKIAPPLSVAPDKNAQRVQPETCQHRNPPLRPLYRLVRLDSVAIFTCLLVVIGAFQVWSFVQSERPVVGITDMRLKSDLLPSEHPTLIIEMVNKGKTTAHIDEFRLHVDGGETLWVNAPMNVDPTMKNVPLIPDIPDNFEMNVPQTIPQVYIDGINKGAYHLWVIGEIKYSDRFGILGGGDYGFCFYYDPSRGRGVDSFYRCHSPQYEHEN